ncbi:polyprenol phosphomannose-dependent alpha 1,6 mannosyltransferase MptB [Saccharopolyspora griseoalba]|uniref:Polyprenol phosphomannose-dependent alpha 1,6 mannosyltransferase MptB n=1 Tax=Saccharopolyspora griseoalba TaxID=1431848 RepID=A0ABW2LNH2_9PSEU
MPPSASIESAPDWSERTRGAGQFSPSGDHDGRPLPLRTIALGTIGSLMMLLGALGAGGTLIHDPILGDGPLSALRYGHGRYIATAVLYAGFALLVWAWVRLGRGVLAHLVESRGVLHAMAAWIAPMIVAPPLFTRDVYSYLGQGLLALNGLDPYGVGPAMLTGTIPENVHPTWQTTPAPYGPLFMGIAKGVILLSGHSIIANVIVMRLVLLTGLALLVLSLPGLVRHLGGRLPVALWLVAASPMTVVQLVGGPHNDMLMIGLLAVGTLAVLDGRNATGIALVSAAMAIKATAGLALPFLVWIWASRYSGSLWRRFLHGLVPALAVFTAVFGSFTLLAKVGLGWLGALSAPGMIVNYLSAPTALGQAVHSLASVFGELNIWPFVGTTRALGSLVLVAILVWNWWQAREGGPEAVRRAAIVLCCGALLSPVLLPWYLSWGLAMGAAFAWTPRALSCVVGGSVLLILAYYPDGEEAMYNWPFMAVAAATAVVGALSLVRFDPLGLSAPLRELVRGNPKVPS